MEDDVSAIEDYFKKYSSDINTWLPDGIIDVNLELLQSMGLLSYHSVNNEQHSLTRYFHLLEAPEKITLINEQFVVWIVPEKVKDRAVTYILIALNQPGHPLLETAFATSGIYNSSRLVLRVLEKFLSDIQETEEALNTIKKTSSQS